MNLTGKIDGDDFSLAVRLRKAAKARLNARAFAVVMLILPNTYSPSAVCTRLRYS